MTDVTIIGGGPVGLFAAFYAGLRGLSTRIIDGLPELGGQLIALYPEKYIYDMPGFPEILAKDLVKNMVQQTMRFNPEIVLAETALKLNGNLGNFEIITSTENTYSTKTVVIAAGAGAFQPTKLDVPKEDHYLEKGLYYGVKHTSTFQNKTIMIVGGGDSALDWTLALEPIAKQISLVHRRDQFRAHETTVQSVQKKSVKMHLWNAIKELHGKEELEAVTLEDLKTKETQILPVEALIVNIGFKSSLGMIKNWDILFEKNQILVNDYLETSRKGVFAIGDNATYKNKIKLIATGVGEAATAVCTIKTQLDPNAKLFPGHSSDMNLKEIH